MSINKELKLLRAGFSRFLLVCLTFVVVNTNQMPSVIYIILMIYVKK